MSKEICRVCSREIDSRGMSGHMKTHVSKKDDTDGVISYPSQGASTHLEGSESTDEISAQGKQITNNVMTVPEQGKPAARSTNAAHPKDLGVKKAVKKTVASKPASKPASSPASKPDPRGQRNSGSKSTGHPPKAGVTEAEHKEEWKGFFRE